MIVNAYANKKNGYAFLNPTKNSKGLAENGVGTVLLVEIFIFVIATNAPIGINTIPIKNL